MKIDAKNDIKRTAAGPSKATLEKPALGLTACEDALALCMKAVRKEHFESMPVRGREAKRLHDLFDRCFMTELRTSSEIASQDALQDTTATHFWNSAVNACHGAQTANIPKLPPEYLLWMRPLLGALVKQLGRQLHIPEPHRNSQSEWIGALSNVKNVSDPITPGRAPSARQCIVQRHHIVENLLQNAAGIFGKAEGIPLPTLRQRRIRDADKLRKLAIQYLQLLDGEHYYNNISPKIKSWIAFSCAQEELAIEAQSVVPADPSSEPVTPLSDADTEGLSKYRANMQPLLRRVNTEFAAALGMGEVELNGWWDLEQAWIGWEEIRSSTSDVPIQEFTKICATIACAAHIRLSRTREYPDFRIRRSAMAISTKEFGDCRQDYFVNSDFNPLPAFVTAILNKMNLQFPPPRF